MPVQTATTGNLSNASTIVVEQAKFTAEHAAPCRNLIDHYTLGKGEKSINVPKVSQMTAGPLTDGIDLTDSEDIGMTNTVLTTGEVGLKVILTDTLVQQNNEDVFRMTGKQMGDAMARYVDEQILGLFTSLNGNTDLGASGRNLELTNLLACLTWAVTNKLPKPVSVVVHPNSLHDVRQSQFGNEGSNTSAPIPRGISEDQLRDFYSGMTMQGIGIYHDGNITIDGSNDGQGAIFAKESMCIIESKGVKAETERDASLRATEVVYSQSFGVFELDDGYGAGMLFVALEPAPA